MNRKRFILIALIALLVLALGACQPEADVVEEVEEAATEVSEAATDADEAVEEEDEVVEPEDLDVEDEPEDVEEVTETLGTEDNPIVMSFVPSGDTEEILVSGDTLADMISERTGLTVVSNVGVDYAAVREAMGAGQAHIGWMNTFNYILANEIYGVDAALVTQRFGSTFYNGQINVNADAGIETLEDLRGKVMCWTDPGSTSGYIIPRIMLQANGIDPDADFAETLEAGSHPNVIIQVYNGECDAGATYADARSAVEEDFPDVTEVVEVLAVTTDIPNDNVAFIADFPADMRQSIVDALLDIAATEEGQEALNNLYSIEGLEETDDSFYDPFRADLSRAGIDIEELATGG
ncbi:MAG: phosphate/phosphite/phosphonate ABC transporter substrate-binding protein [Candidatus Promineifilaceae bacterium]|nr:phosphate/phosphite/phosphonate ABC transporter substrate-binding protein [Candidatus Promineifilaceae bacterium]